MSEDAATKLKILRERVESAKSKLSAAQALLEQAKEAHRVEVEKSKAQFGAATPDALLALISEQELQIETELASADAVLKTIE